MLKSKLKINDKLFTEKYEEIEGALKDSKIKLNDLDSVVNNSNWLSENKEKDIKELVFQLSKIENLVEIEIMDKNIKIEYKEYANIKKLFLIHLSKEWESPLNLKSASNTLKQIDQAEEIFGKSATVFSWEEMRKTVIDLFSGMQYHKFRYQINILTKFQDFYKNQLTSSTSWEELKKSDTLKEIVGDDVKEHLLTKKDLLNLTKVAPNIQDSIIPLLIFEGVVFSKKNEVDELRYLEKSDLEGSRLRISHGDKNKDTDRILDLSPEVTDLVRDAMNQQYIVKNMHGSRNLMELNSSQYILRTSITAKSKKGEDKDDNAISYRGTYSRITVCKNLIESLLYDIPFTPKSIESAGKIYYIQKFINEGYNDIDAIIMTLKRFGNWYKEENGKRDPKNSQQINRLRKIWSLYA